MTSELTDDALASLAYQTASGVALSSLDEDERVSALYWQHTRELLTLIAWDFTIHTAQLSRLAEAPPAKWAYAFALPADRLDTPFALYDSAAADDALGEFEVFGDQVRANVDTLFATYARRPKSPAHWGSAFTGFARTSLAAEFAMSLFEDASKYERLKMHAWGSLAPIEPGGLLLQAQLRHAASLPHEQFVPNGGPLIAARSGSW